MRQRPHLWNSVNHSTCFMELWGFNKLIYIKCLDEYQAHSKHSTKAGCYLNFHILTFFEYMILFFSMLEFSVSDLHLDTLNRLRASLVTVPMSPPHCTPSILTAPLSGAVISGFFFFSHRYLSFTIPMTKVAPRAWKRHMLLFLFSCSVCIEFFLRHWVKEKRW